ncbi:MAG: class I adenylate-forming enzyme family protein [Acidimicrobiales bacterium]
MISQIQGHNLVSDTIGGSFDWAVADHPDQVFAYFEDESFTLAELDHMARRVQAAFVTEGLVHGDRVAVFMYPSPWHLAVIFACARMGVVWCPLNVALARNDLTYTLHDLSPRLILVDDDLAPGLDVVVEADTELAQIGSVRCATYSGKAGAAFDEAWLGGGGEEGSAQSQVAASDTFAIIYSGGTTGRPKGIEISQFYCVSAALRLSEMADFGEREAFFSVLQFSHAWTPITIMPFCLIFDHVFGFWRWWSAAGFVDAVKRMGATVVDPYAGMVSTLFLADAERAEGATTPDFPARLSIAGWGGDEEASKRIRRQFEDQFGVRTLQMYSLTEVGPLACVEWENEEQRFGSSGKPRGWYDVVIADDDGMPLPQGEIGEILVHPKYPNIMAKGYINRAEDTLETWRDLWVHTGDLGYFDPDGYLYFVGRQGHFLRRRGELVSVSEVESIIGEMEAVKEVAVFAVPSEMGEDDIMAVLTAADGHELTPQQVVDHCAYELAAFKVPLYVQVIDSMPRSATKQEIERFRLTEIPRGEPLRATRREAAM